MPKAARNHHLPENNAHPLVNEQNAAERASQRNLVRILVYVLLIFVAGSAIILLILLGFPPNTTSSRISEVDFCSLEDEIFQLIIEKKDDWIVSYSTLTPSDGGTYPAFNVSTAEGHGGLVRPFHSEPDRGPIFYVITESRWPGTQPYGARGYWYSPSGNLPSNNRLRFQQLDGQIYCYWFN